MSGSADSSGAPGQDDGATTSWAEHRAGKAPSLGVTGRRLEDKGGYLARYDLHLDECHTGLSLPRLSVLIDVISG